MHWESTRLAQFTLPAKAMVTLFLLVVGPGYLVGFANIYLKHQDSDLEEGLTPDDLRRNFHGMEKEVTPEVKVTVTSVMLEQVRPGGDMRKYLEKGGQTAVRTLIEWLEAGAKEEDFAKPGFAEEGGPSAKDVIAGQCRECHHADGGDMEDIPYAAAADSEPEYDLVADFATPEYESSESGPQKVTLPPIGVPELVHVTHAHILTIPVIAMIVGGLFLMTGVPPTWKLVVGPLPMLAVVLDIGSWWVARYVEPFIYVIAAAGALFGAAYAVQILCVLGSMWFGRADSTE